VVLAQDNIATSAEQLGAARDGLAAFDLSHDRFQAGVGLELEVLDAEASLQKPRTDLVANRGLQPGAGPAAASLGAVTPSLLLK
jgi:outer membrane protein TolC